MKLNKNKNNESIAKTVLRHLNQPKPIDGI